MACFQQNNVFEKGFLFMFFVWRKGLSLFKGTIKLHQKGQRQKKALYSIMTKAVKGTAVLHSIYNVNKSLMA